MGEFHFSTDDNDEVESRSSATERMHPPSLTTKEVDPIQASLAFMENLRTGTGGPPQGAAAAKPDVL